MHRLRTASQGAGGHRHHTDRAVGGRTDPPDSPVEPVGVGLLSHYIALGNPILEKRDVLHTRRVIAEGRRPQVLGVLGEPSLARDEPEPDLYLLDHVLHDGHHAPTVNEASHGSELEINLSRHGMEVKTSFLLVPRGPSSAGYCCSAVDVDC
ncbi:hypothetical protein Snoj_31870 [Streptomyces nojiriensis]|uniref:Uncharacterized protein n=1 Tax=Streptomyces nojiriensis TaxID=66374 RepID=A0ABQ3SMB0_9ACTN|nr:hypothetical protein GCM10010205_54050 [Streptomyces nojiriensis]GHI69269.1 hypothetical protein Snoj_31870 [Streptomyces nojiriensis]